MLTSVPLSFFEDFPPTVVTHAGRVEDPLVVLDPRDVAVQEVKMVLVSVILLLESVVDLADHVQVRATVLLVLIFSRLLDKGCLFLHVLVTRLLLLGEVSEVRDVVLAGGTKLGVPFFDLTAAFVRELREKRRVIVSSI